MATLIAQQHPGLKFSEMLKKHGISAYRCARDLQVPHRHIYALRDCKRSITPLLALKLERYLGGRAEHWMRLQAKFDIAVMRLQHASDILAIAPFKSKKS